MGIASTTAGGIFDPAGFSKGDMASLKLKEIKNARLAMLVRLVMGLHPHKRYHASCGVWDTSLTCDPATVQAYAGILAQHVVTDTTPLGNLSACTSAQSLPLLQGTAEHTWQTRGVRPSHSLLLLQGTSQHTWQIRGVRPSHCTCTCTCCACTSALHLPLLCLHLSTIPAIIAGNFPVFFSTTCHPSLWSCSCREQRGHQ